jgi:hypothetical protein
MLVFIDESGDSGLKLDSGSSECFVVSLVVFQDYEEANRVEKIIDALKQEICDAPGFEFKFNALAKRHKINFLNTIATCDFFYLSIVINKRKLYGKGFQYKEPFYKYACRLVCENAIEYLKDAIVVIDGSGSREFRKGLATYLKRQINSKTSSHRPIKKVKMEDSRSNNLLQLADMICGAVARSFKTDKSDAKEYRKIIRQREKHVQFWPK